MTLHAVIFDLDGTLLDTIEDLTDSMNAALAALSLPSRSVAECKRLVGEGTEKFARHSLPEEKRGDPALLRDLLARLKAEYRVRNANKTRPYPGIEAMLDGLEARDIPAAILSNKPHPSTLSLVERYFPGRTFRAVFGAREGVPNKPDPTGALEIAALLEVGPSDILYLGDTNTDMMTATAAGMFAVGALWGFRTAKELRDSGARALVGHPEEVLEFFAGGPRKRRRS